MDKTKELEQDLFETVYRWGKVGVKTDWNCLTYRDLLDRITEEKYKEELKLADERFKRAEERIKELED